MTDSNSRYILDKITQINIDTTYRVDQEYLDAIPEKMKRYKDKKSLKRTPEEKRLHIDCEFADEIINHSNDACILPSIDIYKHDFRFKKEDEGVIWCCDNKAVHVDEWYLPEDKYIEFLDSYRNGTIHYFVFWKFIERPTKPLKIGDKPEMMVLSVIPAGELLMKMCDPKNKSQNGNYKVKVI